MLTVLEYLYINSQKEFVSKYHIMTKISEIKKQRPDRISLLLGKLEQNGYIESISTENATFYHITENGIHAYEKWIKSFLDFVRNVDNDKNKKDKMYSLFYITSVF